MNEQELILKRSALHDLLNKRIQWLADKDSQANRLSGQIAIYNEWIESFVKKEDKGETE